MLSVFQAHNKRRAIFIGLLVVFVVGIVGVWSNTPALAEHEGASHPPSTPGQPVTQTSDTASVWVVKIMSWVFTPLITFAGFVLKAFMGIFLWVAQYNDFLNSPAVVIGWPIVRDLMNMFFVVAMLIVAVATILNIEEYHYHHLLSKLLLFAVLINFSKTICGFLIDISQIVMLTFVNAFRDAAVGNVSNALGISDLLSFNTETLQRAIESGDAPTNTSIFASLTLALVMLVITDLVVLAMIVIMTMRVVYLWILVTLSPAAYFLSVFGHSAIGHYASEWWKQFTNYLIVGPIMAFFLWLTFSITAGFNETPGGRAGSIISVPDDQAVQQEVFPRPDGVPTFATKAGTTEQIFTFIVVIGMLIASLGMAGHLGVAGGEFAGSLAHGIQHTGMHALKLPFELGWEGAKMLERKAYAHQVGGYTGWFNPARMISGIKASLEEREHHEEAEGASKAAARAEELFRERKGRRAALVMMTGASQDAWEVYGGFRGMRRVWDTALGRVGAPQVEKWKEQAEAEKEKADQYLNRGKFLLTNEEWVKLRTDKTDLEKAIRELETQLAAPTVMVKLDKTKRAEVNEKIKELKKKIKETSDANLDTTDLEAKEQELRNVLDVGEIEADDEAKKELERELEGKQVMLKDIVTKLDPAEAKKKLAADIATIDQESQNGAFVLDKGKRDVIQSRITDTDDDIKKLSDEAARLTDPKDATRRQGLEDRALDLQLLRSDLAAALTSGSIKVDPRFEFTKTWEEQLKPKKEELEAELKALALIDTATVVGTEAEKEKLQKQYAAEAKPYKQKEDEYQKMAGRVLPPRAIFANLKRLEAEQILAKRLPHHSMEAEELLDNARQALADKDQVKFAVLFKKATEDYNDNEFYNAFGYSADYQGAKSFKDDILRHQLHMTEAEALDLMTDVSYITEEKGHNEASRLVGVKNGVKYFRKHHEQAAIVANENLKQESRRFIQQKNRLAYGGEDADGNYHLGLSGVITILNLQEEIANRIGRGEYNVNAMGKFAEALPLLKKLERQGKLTAKIKSKDNPEITNMTITKFIEWSQRRRIQRGLGVGGEIRFSSLKAAAVELAGVVGHYGGGSGGQGSGH